MRVTILVCCTIILTLSISADAQNHTMGDAKPATMMTGLGDLHHPVSTKNARAQEFFDQGLRLIYAFNHDEAARSFQQAAVLDPNLGLDKFAVMAAFDKRNIDTRPVFSRLSGLPAFGDRPAAKRFVTPTDRGAQIAEFGVNLPSGYNLNEDLVDVVCSALREIVSRRR